MITSEYNNLEGKEKSLKQQLQGLNLALIDKSFIS